MIKTYTLEELEELRGIAAGVVVRHGEAALPIFERLEREVEAAKAKSSAMQRAREIYDRIQAEKPPQPPKPAGPKKPRKPKP